MRVSCIAVLFSAALAAPALAQPIAIDTMPGNTYNAGASHEVRGANAAGGFFSQAYLFTAEQSGKIDHIVTAVEHVSGLNLFAIEVRAGDPNQISPVHIAVWKNLEGGTAADPVVKTTGPSLAGTGELVAGTTYYIVLHGASDAVGRWFQRETPGASTYWGQSTDGVNWWLVNSTQQRALRIVLEGDPCYADCDDNGTLNIDDFLCFINAFAQNDPYADCDDNGIHNIDDFLCFINEFAQGCP